MEVFKLAVLDNLGLQKGGQVGVFVLNVVAVLNWVRYNRLLTDWNLDPIFFGVFNDDPNVALQKGTESLGKSIGWVLALQRFFCTSACHSLTRHGFKHTFGLFIVGDCGQQLPAFLDLHGKLVRISVCNDLKIALLEPVFEVIGEELFELFCNLLGSRMLIQGIQQGLRFEAKEQVGQSIFKLAIFWYEDGEERVVQILASNIICTEYTDGRRS